MYICCYLKTSLKIHEKKKKKKYFEKITVSRQFSMCEISNFDTDHLKDMGQDTVVSFMNVNYKNVSPVTFGAHRKCNPHVCIKLLESHVM